MKIALPEKDNEIFHHFGKTETFKIYTIEDGQIISYQTVAVNGHGHDAAVDLLAENKVALVICGGLGEGAKQGLQKAGIAVISGIEGSCDAAIAAFLQGDLQSDDAVCEHHSEEQGCGGCGEGCGGCSGCGAPAFEGKNVGRTCIVHYRGTFNDGSQFDSSYDRGEPLEFICGAGMMIYGFDKAVADMEPGDIVDVHLMPEEAYGPFDPNAVFTVDTAQLPGSESLPVGEKVILTDERGNRFRVTVTDRTDTTITFDANHEMAGKELNFRIELVEVR